jgi:hypothetical protein
MMLHVNEGRDGVIGSIYSMSFVVHRSGSVVVKISGRFPCQFYRYIPNETQSQKNGISIQVFGITSVKSLARKISTKSQVASTEQDHK